MKRLVGAAVPGAGSGAAVPEEAPTSAPPPASSEDVKQQTKKRKATLDFSTLANCERLPLAHATVYHSVGVIPKAEADKYYEEVKSVTDWKRNKVIVFGRVCNENRLSQSYSLTTEILHYKYSGHVHTAVLAPPVIFKLLDICIEWVIVNNLEHEFPPEARIRTWFNFVLANWYQSGLDTIGLHADDERSLIGPILSCKLHDNSTTVVSELRRKPVFRFRTTAKGPCLRRG